MLRGGEYHAPMLDVESSTLGGPSITLLNPPNSTCPFTGADSRDDCNQVFYDDRAYTSSSGKFVGDVRDAGMLCSVVRRRASAPPARSRTPPPASTARAPRARSATAVAPTPTPSARRRPARSATPRASTSGPTSRRCSSARRSTSCPSPTRRSLVDDSGTTTVNTPLVVPAVGILVNDRGTRISVLTTVTTRSVARHRHARDGRLVHLHARAGLHRPDSFVYTITDDCGQTASATVNLTVTPTGRRRHLDDPGQHPARRLARRPDERPGRPARRGTRHPARRTASSRSAPDGTFDYVPDHDFSGTDTFTYQAHESLSGTSSAPATVTIVVTPTAADDDAGTIAPEPAARRPGPGRADQRPRHQPRRDLGRHAGARHGRHGPRPAATRYTPAPGWGGTDTFTYAAVDGSGQPVSAMVTVRVTAPVQLAAAIDDAADGVPGPARHARRAGQRRARRQPGVRRPERPPARSRQRPARHDGDRRAGQGTWLVTPSGVRFTPVPGFVGVAHLGYSVSNTAGQSVSARLTVTYPQPALMVFPTVATTPAAAAPAPAPPAPPAPSATDPSLAITGLGPRRWAGVRARPAQRRRRPRRGASPDAGHAPDAQRQARRARSRRTASASTSSRFTNVNRTHDRSARSTSEPACVKALTGTPTTPARAGSSRHSSAPSA